MLPKLFRTKYKPVVNQKDECRSQYILPMLSAGAQFWSLDITDKNSAFNVVGNVHTKNAHFLTNFIENIIFQICCDSPKYYVHNSTRKIELKINFTGHSSNTCKQLCHLSFNFHTSRFTTCIEIHYDTKLWKWFCGGLITLLKLMDLKFPIQMKLPDRRKPYRRLFKNRTLTAVSAKF